MGAGRYVLTFPAWYHASAESMFSLCTDQYYAHASGSISDPEWITNPELYDVYGGATNRWSLGDGWWALDFCP